MRRYWWLLILPAMLLLWWGLDHREAAPQVHFVAATRSRIASTVTTNGKVEPLEWAAARAETAGVVQAVAVQRGASVQKGQMLVRLDVAAAQSALAAALAQEQAAQGENLTLGQGGKDSQLASLTNSIHSAEVAVEVAQRNFESTQRLLGKQAVTKLQAQDAADNLERAKLNLEGLKDQRKTLVSTTDKTVAQAKLRDAQSAVALAQHQLALGVIKSPIGGTVYDFDLKVGAYLQPGGQVALIGNLDQMKVTVYVDEPDLGRIAANLPVTITWDARPGQSWSGRVEKLPTEVIALGTRTVGEVTTVVDNPNHDLLPGVTVNVTITSKLVDDALSIPKAALRTIRGIDGVYLLRGDSLVWTPVKTGASDINNVQIVSGLNAGQRVADRVVEPADAEIRNGQRVRISGD